MWSGRVADSNELSNRCLVSMISEGGLDPVQQDVSCSDTTFFENNEQLPIRTVCEHGSFQSTPNITVIRYRKLNKPEAEISTYQDANGYHLESYIRSKLQGDNYNKEKKCVRK